MKKRLILHGEVAFFEEYKVPEDAKELKIHTDHLVVGESETHGNDHRVAVDDRTKFFTKDDIIFMDSIGTEVYCPNKTRHDTIELPKGTWRVGHASEYDYFAEELRKVRD